VLAPLVFRFRINLKQNDLSFNRRIIELITSDCLGPKARSRLASIIGCESTESR
jgi:hypothetical protein